MSYINEQLLTSSIYIPIHKLTKTKNIDGLIKNELKKNNENLCNENGFVVENGINIINRSYGDVLTIDGDSVINYNITYKIKTINPQKDDLIEECVVNSISKMGIISYINYEDKDNIKESPLLIIVPNEYINDNDIKINDKINVSVLDSRIKYKAKQIQVVAKIV